MKCRKRHKPTHANKPTHQHRQPTHYPDSECAETDNEDPYWPIYGQPGGGGEGVLLVRLLLYVGLKIGIW